MQALGNRAAACSVLCANAGEPARAARDWATRTNFRFIVSPLADQSADMRGRPRYEGSRSLRQWSPPLAREERRKVLGDLLAHAAAIRLDIRAVDFGARRGADADESGSDEVAADGADA